MSPDFLPQWIAAAGAPAISVIVFFWKGDDALSQEFKQWLTQKILQVKLTVPDISIIAPLAKVFDLIYGRRYFALSTFLRVAAVSTIALVVSCFVLADIPISSLWGLGEAHPLVVVLAFIMNIFFDYLSVTKSRFIIALLADIRKDAMHVVTFVCLDLILTIIISFVYFSCVQLILDVAFPTREFIDAFIPLIRAFVLTTFLIILIVAVYSISLTLLVLVNFIGKKAYMRWLVPNNILSNIRWVLPIETLPVRSIGIVAGAFVFIFVAVLRAFT